MSDRPERAALVGILESWDEVARLCRMSGNMPMIETASLMRAVALVRAELAALDAEVAATEHRLAWAKDALLYIAAIAAKDRPVPRPDIIECAHREADAIPLRLLNDDGSLRYGNRPEDE